MEYEAFKLDKTSLFYKVAPLKKSAKVVTSSRAMPSYFSVIIKHSIKKEFYVGTSDGEFYPAEQRDDLIALKSLRVDSSLFTFKDSFLRLLVRDALSDVSVNQTLWDTISDAVMDEGTSMKRSNLEAYKGGNSKCPGSVRVSDTLSVDVVKLESYFCYEGVGES